MTESELVPLQQLGGLPTRGRVLRAPGRHAIRALLDAGNAVFAEVGFGRASVDDVAARAGVSRASFYLYFANKDDLLHSMAGECTEAVVEVCQRAGTGSDEAGVALRTWLREFLEAYRRHAGMIRAWNEEEVDDPELVALGRRVIDEFEAAVSRVVAPSSLRSRADSFVLGVLVERFANLLTTSATVDVDRAVETAAEMIEHAFARR